MSNDLLFCYSSKISTCLVIQKPGKNKEGFVFLAINSQPPHFAGFISSLKSTQFFTNLNGTIMNGII